MRQTPTQRYYAKMRNDSDFRAKKAEEQRLRRASETEQERDARLAKHRAAGLRHYAKHKERIRSERMRKVYGIGLEQARQLLVDQDGVCGVCAAELSDVGMDRTTGVVDHCHSTGAVRGILCQQCNSGLGFFRDSPEALEQAAAYLRKHGR